MDATPIDQAWILLAAAAGAVIPVALSSGTSRGRAVVRVICGTTLAVFLAPAIASRYMTDAEIEVQAAVAFLIGCFGLNLMMIVQRVIKTHGEKAVRSLAGIFVRGLGKGGRRRPAGGGSNERIRQAGRGTPGDEGK